MWVKEALERLADLLFGYDFFISYAHRDGREYAAELAGRLAQLGYRVFLDTDVYKAGTNLRLATKRRVRMSTYFVVLAREHAMESEWVRREAEVASTHRCVPVVIDFGERFVRAPEANPVKALLRDRLYLEEGPEQGTPSPRIVDALHGAFRSVRVETRRLRAVSLAAVILALVSVVAIWQALAANAARREAEKQRRDAEEKRVQAVAAARAEKRARAVSEGTSATNLALLDNREIQGLQTSLRAAVTARSLGQAWPGEVLLGLRATVEKARLCWVLRDHEGGVVGAAFSPDGSRLATAGKNGTARLFAADTGKLIARLGTDAAGLWSVVFSPDDKVVLADARGVGVSLFDAHTGAPLGRLAGHVLDAGQAAFSPDGARLVTAGDSEHVRVFEVASRRLLFELDGLTRYVSSASFSPDREILVTTSDDGTLRTWDSRDGRPQLTVRGEAGTVFTGARFLLGSKRIVAVRGVDEHDAVLLDADTGRVLRRLGFLFHLQQDLAVHERDGKALIAIADAFHRIAIFDGSSGKELRSFEGKTGREILSLRFSPGGSEVVSTNQDGNVRVFSAYSGDLMESLAGHVGDVDQAAFSPDGTRVLTAGEDGTARVWNRFIRRPRLELASEAGARCAGVADTDREIAAGYDDGAVRIWDLEHPEMPATLHGHAGPIHDVGYSPDGQRLVTAGEDGTAIVWMRATRAPVLTLRGHGGPVRQAAFSPDGRSVLTAADDQTLRVFDAATGQVRISLGHRSPAMRRGRFSPDGRRIASADEQQTLSLTDMDGAPVAAIPHQQTIRGAAFSPDGKRLAVTSGNASVALWDVSQQSPAQVWSMDVSAGGLALVGEVEISPDGLTVAVVAGYGTVVFLDAATGERVSAVDDESGGGDEVRFSPGGTLLVGVSHGSVTVVPTFDRGNMALACAMLSVQPDADALAPPECASVGATDLLQKLFLLPAHSPELARSLPF